MGISAGFEDLRLTFQERSEKVIMAADAGGESPSEVALACDMRCEGTKKMSTKSKIIDYSQQTLTYHIGCDESCH
jgi:hypothetical protein